MPSPVSVVNSRHRDGFGHSLALGNIRIGDRIVNDDLCNAVPVAADIVSDDSGKLRRLSVVQCRRIIYRIDRHRDLSRFGVRQSVTDHECERVSAVLILIRRVGELTGGLIRDLDRSFLRLGDDAVSQLVLIRITGGQGVTYFIVLACLQLQYVFISHRRMIDQNFKAPGDGSVDLKSAAVRCFVSLKFCE